MTVFHLSKRIAAPLILMALLQFTTNASAGAASLCDPTHVLDIGRRALSRRLHWP